VVPTLTARPPSRCRTTIAGVCEVPRRRNHSRIRRRVLLRQGYEPSAVLQLLQELEAVMPTGLPDCLQTLTHDKEPEGRSKHFRGAFQAG
jgi:hypothetical protein